MSTLAVAAAGVVFGDIGTSPLYALRACFASVAGSDVTLPNVLGILSLIFWSLLIVISVKYVSIILRIDNNGEGGVLALTTRVLNERPLSAASVIATLGLIGCALFYGDGVITPAVTVLGALEGVAVVLPGFEHVVLPLSLIALLTLFALQRKGTGSIGRLFGPMMVLWFLTLAVLGVHGIVGNPVVLEAINPVARPAVLRAAHGRGVRRVRRRVPDGDGRRSAAIRTWAISGVARSRSRGSRWSGRACCSTTLARARCCSARPRRSRIRSICSRRSTFARR